MFSFACPNPQCNEVFYAEDSHIRGRLRCPRCGRLVPIERRTLVVTSATVPSVPADTQHLPIRRPTSRRGAIALYLIAGAVGITLIAAAMWSVGARGRSVGVLSEPHTRVAVDSFRLEPPDTASSQPTIATPPRSLPNGACISRGPRRAGRGELRVKNGNTHDAVVVLTDEGAPDAAPLTFYVRAHEDVHIRRIAPATYRLRFMLGVDWSGEEFTQDEGTFEFVDLFDFAESEAGDNHEFSQWQVTLHPVTGGTAKIVKVPNRPLLLPTASSESAETAQD
jgi:hypothetical protein